MRRRVRDGLILTPMLFPMMLSGDGFAEDFQATDNLGRLQLLLNDPEPWNRRAYRSG